MNSLKMFMQDEAGFTGAEKAVITLIGVGMVLVIGKVVFDSTKTGATNAGTQITSQTGATPVTMQ